jgi:hypothetical protein
MITLAILKTNKKVLQDQSNWQVDIFPPIIGVVLNFWAPIRAAQRI